jgi:hypothetical protein
MALQPDPLHLILGQALLGAVIELRGARAFVRCHFLRVLEGTAIGKVRGDAGRPERMTADRFSNAGRGGAPADHAPSIGLAHRLLE